MTEIRLADSTGRPPRSPRRHLLAVTDLTRDDVERVLDTGRALSRSLDRDVKKLPTLRGRTIVHLFYESSTRTLASFELAAKRLSAIGAPQLVARLTEAHVVNAGDGKHQHPTQALLDLYTMRDALGRLEGLQVAIVGDVLHSRVARSLIEALGLMGAQVMLVGPPPLISREAASL